MINDTSSGFQYFFRGLRLLTAPQLRLFVILPVFISALTYGVVSYYSVSAFSNWLESSLDAIPEWLDFLRYILWPLFVIALLLIVAYTFTLFANIIASPFNGLLAEKVEAHLTNEVTENNQTIMQVIGDFPRCTWREVVKLLYYLPRVIPLIIISIIPGINAIAPLLWFLFGAWMMAIQYCDYPMDNHRLSFGRVKRAVRKNRSCSLAFGSAVSLIAMIPIVNILVMPAAICGATIYWVENLRKQPDIAG